MPINSRCVSVYEVLPEERDEPRGSLGPSEATRRGTGAKPLHRTIVKLLHEEGIAGVAVLRGIEGYGPTGQIHTARIEFLALGLLVVIVAVDQKEKIERVLPPSTTTKRREEKGEPDGVQHSLPLS